MPDSNTLFSTNWYYAQEGNSIGPVPFVTLQALHAAGQITDETFVVEEGRHEWKSYVSLQNPTAQVSLPLPATSASAQDNQQLEAAKAAEAKKEKDAKLGCGCFGAIGLVLLLLFLIGKCSSTEENLSVDNSSTIAAYRGNVSLAQPYRVIGQGNGIRANAVWIFSPTAQTAEQRAATVYVAGKEIQKATNTAEEFTVLLAIDPSLARPIPNSNHSLYLAAASLKKQKFVNGKWKPIAHWSVDASLNPLTQESVDTLKSIFEAASSRNLKNSSRLHEVHC